jgi:hypothetical protein
LLDLRYRNNKKERKRIKYLLKEDIPGIILMSNKNSAK